MNRVYESGSGSDMEGRALPLDCRATYYPGFMSLAERDALFRHIRDGYDLSDRRMTLADGTVHQSDTGAMMFVDPTLVGEFDAAIWGQIAAWTAPLEMLKDRIERLVRRKLPVCRCIHYKDGGSGVGFHADYPAYGDLSCIASVSLGEEREFQLRRTVDPADIYSLTLGNGSLLVMGEGCQERYEHALPTVEEYKNPRINLTFRPFGWE